MAGDVLELGGAGAPVRHLAPVVLAQVTLAGEPPARPGADTPAAAGFRLRADASGETHFEDVDLMRFGSPAAKVQFVSVPEGSANRGWHGAPRRQLVVWLAGSSSIEASDGDRREVGPGDVFLVEDMGSRGHRNHHRGDVRVMFVHLT